MAFRMNRPENNSVAPALKKNNVDHQKDMEDQVAGPVAKGDVGPVSRQQKHKSIEQENQLESMIEETNFDIENERISEANGRKKIEQLQRKLKQLKTGR